MQKVLFFMVQPYKSINKEIVF